MALIDDLRGLAIPSPVSGAPATRISSGAFSTGGLNYVNPADGSPGYYEQIIPELRPQGRASTLAFGQAKAIQYIQPEGRASTVAFGTAWVRFGGRLYPPGLPSTLVIGQAKLTQYLAPEGRDSTLAIGTARLVLVLAAQGVPSTLAFGQAYVAYVGEFTVIQPEGRASTLQVGLPQLRRLPQGLDQHRTPRALTAPMELRTAQGDFVGLLPLATEVRVRQAMNSLDTLSFQYPVQGPLWPSLVEGALVRLDGEDYRITSVRTARDAAGPLVGTITAEQYCVNLGDRLKRALTCEDEYPEEILEKILEGTGWQVGGVSPRRLVSMSASWSSPLALILELADIINAEVVFDTQRKRIYLLYERGSWYGAALIYRKNLVGVECERSGEVYNRIYFEGKDGLSSLRGYVEDQPSIARYGRRDYYWRDENITSLHLLLYGATLRLEAYRTPRISYRATAYNLKPYGRHWPVAELGDYVRVYDEELGIDVMCRVYEREYAPFDPTVPDSLVLSTTRRWFPDLAEKIVEVTEPTSKANARLQQRVNRFIPGPGAINYIKGVVPLKYKGDGKPHAFTTNLTAADPNEGLPKFHEGLGIWFSGRPHPKGYLQLPYDGPLGIGGTKESFETCTHWIPHGLDTDGDGKEDFWYFSGKFGRFSIPGGHCYDGSGIPKIWDYGGEGAQPYKAKDVVPAGEWFDTSEYLYFGYDQNGDGYPEEYDDIDNMPNPLFRRPGDGLKFGLDLFRWVDPPTDRNPIFHHYNDADDIYLTGWSEAGARDRSGPIGYFRDGEWVWDPEPVDTDGDGTGDFWPYGEALSYGRDWDPEFGPDSGLHVPTEALDIPAMGGAAITVVNAGVAKTATLTVSITESGDFETEPWEHGFDTDDEIVQFFVTPRWYDRERLRITDLRVERITSTLVKVHGHAEVL